MGKRAQHAGSYTGINRFFKIDSLQTLLNKWYDGTSTDFFDDWKWIFSFSTRYKGIIAFYTFLGIFGSTLSLGAAWVSRMLINIVVGKQIDKLWVLILVMVGSTIFSLVVSNVLGRVGLKISIRVNNDIQSDIFNKFIDAEWKELNRYPNGDLLNRFNSDVDTVAGNAISWIPNLIVTIYSFIATFILLFKTDPNMAWFALGSAPFLLIMSRIILRKMRENKKRVLEMNSAMMSFEVDTFYNFDMIKSFGVAGQTEKKLKWWQGKYRDYNLDFNTFQIKTNIALSLVSSFVTLLAFCYCLWRLWTNQILYGDMSFFLTQKDRLTGQFNSLVGTIPGMVSSAISAHRIRELVELPKEKHNPESRDLMAERAKEGLSIAMNHVRFAYVEDKTVYEDGSFHDDPGEIAPIILLDEATSALDNETERRVLQNIIFDSPHKTCIVSTHRRSILRHCQRVYYIQNKQAEEFVMKPTEEIPEVDD